MMTPETEQQCDEQLAALTALFRSGVIDSGIYHKMMVALAYEMAMGEKYLRAATLVQGIPVEYFRDVQRGQMEVDADYANVAYTLALTLLQQGFVHIGPTVTPTMPAAMA